MVSESDELSDQIADATKFLRDHFTALEAWPRGKEISRTLDFSMFVPSFYEFPAQFLRWPAELLKLAGTLGIDIELSQYAVSDEAEEEEEQR